MLSRRIRPSLLDSPWAQLPTRFRSITTVSHTTSAEDIPNPLLTNPSSSNTPNKLLNPNPPTRGSSTPKAPASAPKLPPPSSEAPGTSTTPISDSVKELLPLLKAQSPHYITIHIHGKPYLVTAGDTIKLPFLMHGVIPGDILRLNRAVNLGSRDYTLKAAGKVEGDGKGRPSRPSYLDERLFVCRAVVMGVESEPMRVMEKTKRRQRHTKTVRSKHRYTVLRVSEVSVRNIQEAEADEAREDAA